MDNTLKQQPKSLRHIASQQHGKSTLAIAVSAAIMSSVSLAQTATSPTAEEESVELETLEIEERTIDTNPYAQPGAPYKAKISGDPRHVKPLAETPQTITVITQTQIKESGATDLREVLDAQPGITLGTGENGNAFGDRYIIRGHEARSDVFVDSLRDPGMTIRESFATEQVEVTKGPSSTFAGRGTSGGAINSISKLASTEYDFSKVQAGVGTDKYYRTTLDANQTINENLAVRANLLEAYEQVPDRDPLDRDRAGIALSGLVKATDKLTLIGDYYYLNAEDLPDLGTYIRPNGGRPYNDMPVYAQHDDFLESEVEVFTLRQHYDFQDNVSLKNAVRYGTTDNGYVATGARGVNRSAADPTAPGAPTITLSTNPHNGWQEVEYFVDQLNLFVDTELAGMQHQFIFGSEYSDHKVLNGIYNNTNALAPNCSTGTSATNNSYCIVDGNFNPLPNLEYLTGRQITKGLFDSDYQVDTLSLSVMDTIDVTDDWMLTLGARRDDFDYTNIVVPRSGANANIRTDYGYDDDLWNYQTGVTYKINPEGNVYFNYSTSSELNGGESDLGANCGYGGICGNADQVAASEPEDVKNLELGTKWNLLNEKLLLTAVMFQITKDDVMEGNGANPYSPDGNPNTGKNRVDGYELSLTGNITQDLSVAFGAAMMESEILDSFVTANEGRVLSNFADDSLYLQVRYQMTPAFAFGGVARYSSEMFLGQPDTAAAYNNTIQDYSFKVPSYTVYDLFASYDINEKASLMLNVGNVFDKDYYLAGYRSGGFAYIGDARSAKLTLSYDF